MPYPFQASVLLLGSHNFTGKLLNWSRLLPSWYPNAARSCNAESTGPKSVKPTLSIDADSDSLAQRLSTSASTSAVTGMLRRATHGAMLLVLLLNLA